MASAAEGLRRLLDALRSDANVKGTFVGIRVTEAILRARYPPLWLPLIERYVELVGESGSAHADRVKAFQASSLVGGGSSPAVTDAYIYCDMVCTIITKKIRMVDIFYLYEPAWDENEEMRRLREVHMLTATKYLVKILTCVHECVYARLPDKLDVNRAASMLYAELYAEAFDVATVTESDVFRLVENWFRVHVLKADERAGASFRNVAPETPFVFCSHVYWLWLHLTAARVRHSAQDLLTVIYALDTIVYCGECRGHFINLRSEYFSYNWDGETRSCVSHLDNSELLFRLHNRVNVRTGSPEMDVSILSEYADFWKG